MAPVRRLLHIYLPVIGCLTVIYDHLTGARMRETERSIKSR